MIKESIDKTNNRLTDYMKLVEKCNLEIKIITRINNFSQLNNSTKNKLPNLLDKIKNVFSIQIETPKQWQKNIICNCLKAMIIFSLYKKNLTISGILLSLLLLTFFNVFIFGFSVSTIIIIYIPIMLIHKELDNYYIINLSHERKDYLDKRGKINSTQQKESTTLSKYITMQKLVSGTYKEIQLNKYNSYENEYIRHIENNISKFGQYIILIRGKDEAEFKIYK